VADPEKSQSIVKAGGAADALLLLAPLIVGSFLVSLSASALSTLIGVRLAARADSATHAGMVFACHYVGLVIGCRALPPLIVAIGHVRAFALFTGTATCVTLLIALIETPLAWAILRIGTGLCAAGTLMTIESWVNQQVGKSVRGLVFGAYLISGSAASSVAPMSLALFDPARHELFLVIAACYALAPLAMLLKLPRVPVIEGPSSQPLNALIRLSPAGFAACVMHGMVNSALIQVSPIYFGRLGIDHHSLSLFLTLASLAAVVMQMPVGALADRFGRHRLLTALALAGAASAGALALAASPGIALLFAVGIALAAATSPFYGLGAAITNDRAQGLNLVGVSGGLLLGWAAGAIAGPVISTLLIDLLGPRGLFVHIAAMSTALAGLVAWRFVVRRPPIPAPPPPQRPPSP
jgi:MFS family permease